MKQDAMQARSDYIAAEAYLRKFLRHVEPWEDGEGNPLSDQRMIVEEITDSERDYIKRVVDRLKARLDRIDGRQRAVSTD